MILEIEWNNLHNDLRSLVVMIVVISSLVRSASLSRATQNPGIVIVEPLFAALRNVTNGLWLQT